LLRQQQRRANDESREDDDDSSSSSLEDSSSQNQNDRRRFLGSAVVGLGFLANPACLLSVPNAWAESSMTIMSTTDDSTRKRVVESEEFGYWVELPSGLEASPKPLKTHLDERNFSSTQNKKYQYGLTVDPVRIQHLSDFGTPEQVAARVVTAEVNRDGVTSVTLVTDPTEDPTTGAYLLNYLSQGYVPYRTVGYK